jgi:Reverse transcriptase (RNA-dependent DNA polymerase)
MSETAVVKIQYDIAHATDSESVSTLVLFNFSAVFDTVDFGIFLDIRFSVQSSALEWPRSHLFDRTQIVVVGVDTHGPLPIYCLVPQGSVVGPSCFVVYTEELADIVNQFSIMSHLYAGDTALLSYIPPSG